MFGWLDVLMQDVRFSYRSLCKPLGVTVIAMMTMACGLAVANTTFAVVNGALIRGLPYPNKERLLHLGFRGSGQQRHGRVSYAEFRDLEAMQAVRIAAFAEASVTLAEDGRAPDRVEGLYASAHALELLGAATTIGRSFVREDDTVGAHSVAILSEAIWASRYERDPNIIGRSVRVNGSPATIIGVVPAHFALTPTRTDIWLPLAHMLELDRQARNARTLNILGQLRTEMNANRAGDELGTFLNRFRREFPNSYTNVEEVVVSLQDRFISAEVRQIAFVLLGAGMLVLLIACANAANLLLGRTTQRQHEIATRVALGASRWHIWRQLLIECSLLGGGSALAALAMSIGAIRMFAAAIAATNPPVWLQFEVDGNVFVFLATVSVVGSLALALLPAVQASRQHTHPMLQQGGRTITQGRRAQRWSTALVGIEVALTLVLLAGAGLMMRTFWSLLRTDLGVDTQALTVLRIDTSGPKYAASAERVAFFDSLEDRLGARSRLSWATVVTSPPGADVPPQWTFQREGRWMDAGNASLVSVVGIGDGYFETLNRPIVRGRSFERLDGTPGRQAAIVNERLASRLFPEEEPIGQRIRVVRSGRPSLESEWLTIVGIAPTVNHTNPLLGHGPDPLVYVPYRSRLIAPVMVLARGGDPSTVIEHVRSALLALDPGLAVFDGQSLDAFLAFFRWPQRVFGTVLLIAAAIALLLACVGLYAIVAFSVVRRTHEISVRLSLGAPRQQVLLLVLRRAVVPFGAGLLAGSLGTLVVGQLLTAFLVDTNPRDPATLLGVSALLCFVGLVACAIPARRATRVDPLAALRCE
jgi:putative ABC transport system permease protein